MGKLCFDLERTDFQRLILSWEGESYLDESISVMLEEQPVGVILNRKALAEGRSFQLPDASQVQVQFLPSDGIQVMQSGKKCLECKPQKYADQEVEELRFIKDLRNAGAINEKEYQNRLKLIKSTYAKVSTGRDDMSVYRQLITFQVSANDLHRGIPDVFYQIGIAIEKQYHDTYRVLGSWSVKGKSSFRAQTRCIPINDESSVLTFACSQIGSAEKGQKSSADSFQEIDRKFHEFLAALQVTLSAGRNSIGMQVIASTTIQTLDVNIHDPGQQCIVTLTPTFAIFTDPKTGRAVCVPRNRSREEIVFQNQGELSPFINIESEIAAVAGVTYDFKGSKKIITDWMPPIPYGALKKSIRGWGGGLILVGVASVLLSNIFDPLWGILLIALGVLNLLIIHRVLFIANGLMLIAVGIMNIVNLFSLILSQAATSRFWFIYGLFQIGWGIQEFTKFSKYRNTKKDKTVD